MSNRSSTHMTRPDNHYPLILSFASGKGGVGKSMTSVNTAETLNGMGYRVALIDVDMGLSNCATLMNEPSGRCVSHWIRGECCLEDLPQECQGVTLITGSDDPDHQDIPQELMLEALDQILIYLSDDHDFLVIDTAAGIGSVTLWALERAQLGVLVLVDEPTSISDVYRLCKHVYGMDPTYPFACIVNRANSEESARQTFKRLNSILNYFMRQQAVYLGFIPFSQAVVQAIRDQLPVMRSARERVAGMDPLTEVQPADDHAGRQQNPEDQTLEEVAAAEGTFAALPEADQTLIQEFLFIAQNLISYAKKLNQQTA